MYINELAKTLERSKAPSLTLHHSEFKLLQYAHDLVLLPNSTQGLHQNLSLNRIQSIYMNYKNTEWGNQILETNQSQRTALI